MPEAVVQAAVIIESSSAVLLSEPSLSAASPDAELSEESSGEESSGNEPVIGEVANEHATSDAPLPPFHPELMAEEGQGASLSEAAPNQGPADEQSSTADQLRSDMATESPPPTDSFGEASTGKDELALPVPAAVAPGAAAEILPLPTPEALAGDATAVAALPEPLVGDAVTASDLSASGDAADTAPQDSVEPAAPVIARPEDHVVVDHDVEQELDARLFGDADEQQNALDQIDRAVAGDGEGGTPLDGEPSRTPPPESQLAVDPEDDPGDLFEPVTEAPMAATVPPSALAANLAHPDAPSGESAAQAGQNQDQVPQPSMNAGQAASSSEPPAPATLAPAVAPITSPVVKPAEPAPLPSPPRAAASAPPTAPRPTANDPLAPVRALSEEEMIALFS
jgi:hypothetical protein